MSQFYLEDDWVSLLLLSFVFLALPLYDAGTGRYTFRHPDVTADGGTFADGDTSQDGGVGIDNHIVFQYRVAGNSFDRIPLLVAGEALGSQGDSLIQFHVVTDDAGRSDDYTCAVVNSKVVSDLGTRMDVDTGSEWAISVMIRGMSGTLSR